MGSASQSQEYCLRWNSHRSNLLTVFDELLQNEAFTDVILAVEGGASIKCHKMVLAACSMYFQNLFIDLPWEQQTIVVLKDVKYSEIKAILEYMYRGEVNVGQEQLAGLLRVAEVLKVKGLVNDNHPHTDTNRRRSEELLLDDRSASSPPGISASTTSSVAAHSSSHVSPPPPLPSPQIPISAGIVAAGPSGGSYHPYDRASYERGAPPPPLPLWSFGGLNLAAHQQQASSHLSHLPSPQPPSPSLHLQSSSLLQQPSSSLLGGSYNNGFETSPLKRKKTSSVLMNRVTPILRGVLSQQRADSSLLYPDSQEPSLRSNSNGSVTNEQDRRSSTDAPLPTPRENERSPAYNSSDNVVLEEDERLASPQSFGGDSKSGILNYSTATPKPEWKRYKQYTRQDILSAIEAVRRGTSALRAARTFGVPSRTLYDKVKKLGISTPRPFKRGCGGNSSGSASFPVGIGANINGNIYISHTRGRALSESENDVDSKSMTVDHSVSGLETDTAASGGYVKIEQDRETDNNVAKCSASPVIHTTPKQQQPQQQPQLMRQMQQQPQPQQQQLQDDTNIEDEVEDLSVSRRSDIRIIVPPALAIKEESDMSGDKSNCN